MWVGPPPQGQEGNPPYGTVAQSRALALEGLGSNPACVLSCSGALGGRSPSLSLSFLSATPAGARMKGVATLQESVRLCCLPSLVWVLGCLLGTRGLYRDPTRQKGIWEGGPGINAGINGVGMVWVGQHLG